MPLEKQAAVEPSTTVRPHYTTECRPKQEIVEKNYDTGDEEERAKKGKGGAAATTSLEGGEARVNPAFVIDDSDIPSRETSCEREVA